MADPVTNPGSACIKALEIILIIEKLFTFYTFFYKVRELERFFFVLE